MNGDEPYLILMEETRMSELNNGTQVPNDGAVEANVQQPVQNPPVVQTPAPVTTVEQKPNWFKRNWKKILAGAGAVVAVVGSGVAAYSKGKKAGVNMAYAQQPEEDYSLDPNV